MKQDEKQRNALGYASLMLITSWEAARGDGEAKAPEKFAMMEKAIAAGEAGLCVTLQRIGGSIRVTAAVMPPEFQDPFEGGGIVDLVGPLVLSREQLEGLLVIKPSTLN